jgi:hypothetical protein
MLCQIVQNGLWMFRIMTKPKLAQNGHTIQNFRTSSLLRIWAGLAAFRYRRGTTESEVGETSCVRSPCGRRGGCSAYRHVSHSHDIASHWQVSGSDTFVFVHGGLGLQCGQLAMTSFTASAPVYTRRNLCSQWTSSRTQRKLFKYFYLLSREVWPHSQQLATDNV